MRHGEYGYTVYSGNNRVGSVVMPSDAIALVAARTAIGMGAWIEYQTDDGRASGTVWSTENDEIKPGADYVLIGDFLISRARAIEKLNSIRMQRRAHINGDS